MSEKLNEEYMKRMVEIEKGLYPKKREGFIQFLLNKGDTLEEAKRQANFWYKN